MTRLFVLDKVYSDRHHIFPLLKPFFKGERFTDRERKELYGISEKEIDVVHDIDQADYAILPMSWNFYRNQNKVSHAESLVIEASKNKLKTLSFTNGDFGVKIPSIKNLYVFRSGGDRSKLSKTHVGLPSFIEDPLKKHFKSETVSISEYGQKPIVGFCGHAKGSVFNAVKEFSKTCLRNLLYYINLKKGLPQQLLSTSFLRAMLIKRFQNDKRVISNFILRKKYRAGVTTKDDRQRTTQEFYNNLEDSQYIICVRGAGNFGRIPVFINTDCILPLTDTIGWKEHVVWVEYKERNDVVEKTMQFHKSLSVKGFKELQKNNRKLWEEKLTLGGFFKVFFEEMKKNRP